MILIKFLKKILKKTEKEECASQIEEKNQKYNCFDQDFFHSQKMNAIGNLAGGIAHDFNNLLTAILGFSELLLLKHPAGDPSFPELIQIRQNTIRASNLVSQLLAFSRKQVLEPSFLNSNNVLFNIFDLLKRLIGEEIELELNLDPKNEFVFLDRGQFEQIIINLVINSKDAINEFSKIQSSENHKGKISIKSSQIFLESIKDLENYLGLKPGDLFSPEICFEFKKQNYLLVEISDNGSGIEKSNLNKIFDPFFSTKKVGEGTGLGLSTVYGIVLQSEGHLFVHSKSFLESKRQNGTSFFILFKAFNPSEVSEKNPIDENQELELNSDLEARKKIQERYDLNFSENSFEKNILLIEDEEAVRQLLKIALENNGYNVFEAKNGDEAFSIAKDKIESGLKIDLVLTDVILPGLNGYEIHIKLLENFPDLKTIFISGYTKDEIRGLISSLKEGSFLFLQKPFTIKKILDFIKKILNKN